MRSCQTEEDYWRIRELSWHVARWGYWIWFANPEIEKIPLEGNVYIWETGAGQIAAVLNPEQREHAFSQIHPDFHTSELDQEMIAVAEEHLTTTEKDGCQKINFWIDRLFLHTLVRRCDPHSLYRACGNCPCSPTA